MITDQSSRGTISTMQYSIEVGADDCASLRFGLQNSVMRVPEAVLAVAVPPGPLITIVDITTRDASQSVSSQLFASVSTSAQRTNADSCTRVHTYTQSDGTVQEIVMSSLAAHGGYLISAEPVRYSPNCRVSSQRMMDSVEASRRLCLCSIGSRLRSAMCSSRCCGRSLFCVQI